VLLRSTLPLDQIAEVIFAVFLVGVLLHEVLFIGKLQNDGKETQKWKHDIRMECFYNDLNLREMGLDQVRLWVFALEVLGELRDVENLNIISHIADLATACSAPTIVISISIVNLILSFLFNVEIEEVLCDRELLLDLLIGKSEVLHVEEANLVNYMLELFGQSFFSAWKLVVFEVECHELGPREIFLRFRRVNIGCKAIVAILACIFHCEQDLLSGLFSNCGGHD